MSRYGAADKSATSKGSARRPIAVAWSVGAVLFTLIILGAGIQLASSAIIGEQPGMSDVDRIKSVSDLRTSLIQLLGGIGLAGGFIYTVRTYLLSRGTQHTDRFAKAIEQIGTTTSATVRSGGVYGLWQLCLEEDSYWGPAEAVLCGFLRERAVENETGDVHALESMNVAAPDVQAAATVIARRPRRKSGKHGAPLDLRRVNLTGCYLPRANFDRVLFDHAIFHEAILADATFERASLSGATFRDAELASASFIETALIRARFHGANLYQANFLNANVAESEFSDSKNLTQEQLSATLGAPRSLPW